MASTLSQSASVAFSNCRDHVVHCDSSRLAATRSSGPAKPGALRVCKTPDVSLPWAEEGLANRRSTKVQPLSRQCFSDSTVCWSRKEDVRIARSPDFQNRAVEVQLSQWDAQLEVDRPLSASTLQHDASFRKEDGGGYLSVQVCSGMCANGQLSEAVDALGLLVQSKSPIPPSLFYSLLKGCLAEKNLDIGRRVHALAVECGHQSNAFLANHILRMYAFHGRLQEATEVFAQVTVPNTFMWFSIISAYVKHEKPAEAIKLYQQMRQSTVKPNNHIFVAALKGCIKASDLEFGRQVHAEILESGIVPDMFLTSCLIDMYAKCGSLGDARIVFDSTSPRNVVTWTAMIAGYAEQGFGKDALELYARMELEGSILANAYTFSCVLKACMTVKALQYGIRVHSQICARGMEADLFVGTCLIEMYSKCGSLEEARKVFDSLPTKDVVAWTAMISAYTEHGCGDEALALYARAEGEGTIVANSLTFASVLRACTSIGAIQQGRQLHAQIQRRKLEADLVVGSCLVEMYAQCGYLEDACRVFESMPKRDVITWTAIVNGYGQCAQGRKAIQCFHKMLQDGVQPDETTFTCLLVACSHQGLVDEGQHLFHAMKKDHGIVPTSRHYLCLADMLGRSGHLDDAERVLLSMPYEVDKVGWTSLLHASKSYGDLPRGARCFEKLITLEPQHASAYVLMANLYADAGKWTDVERIETLRKTVGACKKPAQAGIEVNNQVHTFVVGEQEHGMNLKLETLNGRLKQEGSHLPHTELVLKPIPEMAKEDNLCGHAEKLALAYGLLNTPDGTTLFVTKNLRMCSDCHSATQIMSRVEKREIIVRDGHRVHQFVEGLCSCGGRP